MPRKRRFLRQKSPIRRPDPGRRAAPAKLRVALPLGLALGAVALVAATRHFEREAVSPFPLAPTIPYSAAVSRLGLEPPAVAGVPAVPLGFQAGETLGQVLEGLGLSAADAAAVGERLAEHVNLRRLRPRDTYRASWAPDGRLASFEVRIAGEGTARVEPGDGGWTGSWHPFVRSVGVRSIRGTLSETLESAVLAAGGDATVAYLMADVFQWDLDFNRDLRVGDRFEILYEEVYLDGTFESLGEVLAATYTNLGRRLEAYRFGDPAGYYDAEGRPMRKMFLRSPLRFSRITSRFTTRRFHPILKSYRPHYGVDYGAPTGTPVRVTANGVVSFAGWDGGGGKTVKVRHPNGYVTAYLHLSGFASGVAPGRRVGQGDVIGYVGSTGLATASHLDYRVQLQGRWLDPQSLKSVPTEPLGADVLPRFERWREALSHSLATGDPLDLEGQGPGGTALATAGPEESAAERAGRS